MQTRRFGRTEHRVPAITFGGGWVGGVLIHQEEDTAFAALERATGAGIDWIDTAALYGEGVSETVIGRWLQAREGRPRISTKFRLDPSARDLEGQMMRSVEASLTRLGLDGVEVIILHNTVGAEEQFGYRSLTPKGALEVADMMERLRDEGLCQHLGMTALGGPAELHETVGAGRFDVAQVYYNLLNPTAAEGRDHWNSTNFDGLLGACRAQDMGVMGIRIFAGGHLPTEERHGREIPVTANADDAAEERRAAQMWANLIPEDGTRAQAAIRFGLANEDVSTIVVGLAELSHLEEAIGAVEMGPLEPERLEAVARAWAAPVFTGH